MMTHAWLHQAAQLSASPGLKTKTQRTCSNNRSRAGLVLKSTKAYLKENNETNFSTAICLRIHSREIATYTHPGVWVVSILAETKYRPQQVGCTAWKRGDSYQIGATEIEEYGLLPQSVLNNPPPPRRFAARVPVSLIDLQMGNPEKYAILSPSPTEWHLHRYTHIFSRVTAQSARNPSKLGPRA